LGPDIIPPLKEAVDIEIYEDKSLISKLEYLQQKLIYLIKEQKTGPASIHVLVLIPGAGFRSLKN
tara:strand:- start:918 stop:1112 length:195 start_codon:yes stop_codon:yes gene_type:complete